MKVLGLLNIKNFRLKLNADFVRVKSIYERDIERQKIEVKFRNMNVKIVVNSLQMIMASIE